MGLIAAQIQNAKNIRNKENLYFDIRSDNNNDFSLSFLLVNKKAGLRGPLLNLNDFNYFYPA